MTDSFFKNEPEEERDLTIPELKDNTGRDEDDSDSWMHENLSEEGRMAAIMSYIPILCFVPLLNMQDNKEARFHARQGVLLFLIEIIAVIFMIDGISDFFFKAVLVIAVGLSLAGIYFAFKGKNYKLPIIGDMADKTKF